jgi:hypothetical protein
MLVDKVSEELYNAYCLEEYSILQGNEDYKDANELASYAWGELKKILPEDKEKFYVELENYINYLEGVRSKQTYKYAFKQGAKFIIELLGDRL